MAQIIVEDPEQTAPIVARPKRKIVLKRRGGAAAQETPAPPPQEPSTGRLAAAALTRTAGGVLGSMLPAAGAATGTPIGVGAGLGGAVLTGGASELAAQALEENVPLGEIPGKMIDYLHDPKRVARAGFEGGMTALPGKFFFKAGADTTRKVMQSGLRGAATAGGGETIRGLLQDKTLTDNLPNILMAGGLGFATGGLLGRFLPDTGKIGPVPTPKPKPAATYADLMKEVHPDPTDATKPFDTTKFRAGLPNVMHREGWGTNLERILSQSDELEAAGNKEAAKALREVGLGQGHWDEKVIQAEINRLVAQGKPQQAMALAEAAVETRKGGSSVSKWVERTRTQAAVAAEKKKLLEAKQQLAATKLTTAQERLQKFRDSGAQPKEKASVSVSETDPITGEKITHTEEFKPRAEDDVDAGRAPRNPPPPITPEDPPPPGGRARQIYDGWVAAGKSHIEALAEAVEGNAPPVVPTAQEQTIIETIANAAMGKGQQSAAPVAVQAAEGALSADDEAAALRKAWGVREPTPTVPRAKPVTPALATRIEEAAKKLEAAIPGIPKGVEPPVEGVPNLSPRQAQPYAPIVLEEGVAEGAGKAAQGATATAKLMNPDMPALPGAGGTSVVPEARDAVVEQLEKRVGPQTSLVGGRRATDLPARISQEPPSLSAAMTPDEIAAQLPPNPDVLELLKQESRNNLHLMKGNGAAPIADDLAARVAKLEENTPRPPISEALPGSVVSDTDLGRTSGPLKAARKRATQVENEIKKTETLLGGVSRTTPEGKLLVRQLTNLKGALDDVNAKIGELESALPAQAAEVPTTSKQTAPAKADPTQVMSSEEMRDIADSILNARTGELGAWEATAAWRAASNLYHTAKTAGQSFVPDPRGLIDSATGEVALIPLSVPKESKQISLGKLVSQVMPKELEAAGVIPPGFAGKVSKEIREAIAAEAQTRWQEGAGPPRSPLGSEGAAPVVIEPEGTVGLQRSGSPLEGPPATGAAEGMNVTRSAEEIPGINPKLAETVAKFRQAVLSGSFPPDQIEAAENTLQKQILMEMAEAVKKEEGGTTLGFGLGGMQEIQDLIKRNPEFAMKALLTAGGALTGAITDPFDDPVLSALLGAGTGMGGAKALNALKKSGIDLTNDPLIGAALRNRPTMKEALSSIYQLAPHIQRTNYLLSGPGLVSNAVLGPMGAGFFGTLTKALAGDKRGWGATKEFMNPTIWAKEWNGALEEAQQLIQRAAAGDPLVRAEVHGDIVDKILRGSGPKHLGRLYLQGPAVAMAAGDIATRRILMRHGFSDAEARMMTMTSEPVLPTLQKILNVRRGKQDTILGPAMDVMFPFVRTPLNILEQGAQRFPGLGLALQSRMESKGLQPVTPWAEKIAQQGVSTALLFSGYFAGLMTPPEQASAVRRVVSNASGQYSLVVGLGFAMGQGAKKRNTGIVGSLATPEVSNFTEWSVPLPTMEPALNWKRFIENTLQGKKAKTPPGAIPAFLNEPPFKGPEPIKAKRRITIKRTKVNQ